MKKEGPKWSEIFKAFKAIALLEAIICRIYHKDRQEVPISQIRWLFLNFVYLMKFLKKTKCNKMKMMLMKIEDEFKNIYNFKKRL